MNKTTILVVEDDVAVRNLITTTLDTHDYRYIRAENGQNALKAISSKDLGLPDIDGIDVIKRVRNWSEVPIIVISARCEDTDKIDALDSGADDYLTKPFSVEELLARLRVTQRRLASLKNSDPEDSEFRNGEMKIDYAAGSVFMNGEEIHLTPIEYKLLCLLAQNSGKVLTHTFITNSIWGSSFDSDVASLRVFMATLRKKLDKSSKSGQQYIQTHVGVGYRMNKL